MKIALYMTRPSAEMACGEPDEPDPKPRIDPEAASFFRGLVCGVPLGAAMWTVILGWLL